MSYSRSHPNAGIRCPGHDYRSKCIYHIVLNKADGFPKFSDVTGVPGDRQWKPTTALSREGEIIGQAISGIKMKYPHVSILRRCIMPDHVHFAIFIKEATDIHLGTIIASLKKDCSDKYEYLGYSSEVKFFTDGYYDTFLTGRNQLKKMLSYISDNPRRHLIRKEHSGWFCKFSVSNGEHCYQAYGNWALLSEYQRIPVKVSRKYSSAELFAWKKLWHTTVLNDGILVSPFINPKEKKIRDWAIDNGGALIYITYKPFPEKFKPYGNMFDLCSEGRLLIVSLPGNDIEDEYLRIHKSPSYFHCRKMNELAASIANQEYFPIF